MTVSLLVAGFGSFAYAQYPGFDGPGGGRGNSGGTGLVPVSAQVDGGSIPVGATAQVVVLFRNDGGQPVQTGKINLYPSSNVSAQVSLNQCGDPLPAGAECALAISVKALQAGAWRLELLMLHSGRSRLVTTTLSGNVEAGADSSDRLSSDLETIPDDLDFGALASGQAMVESIILRNITSTPLKISDIGINAAEGAGYSVDSECDVLNAGQACVATVTWSPKQKGPATGVLVIKHDGPTAIASVSLSGDYEPDDVEEAEVFPEAVPGRGLLIASQSEMDFGSAITAASTMTVSLVNTGDTPLTINEIKLAGSDNGLIVDADGCSADLVLAPIEACPLTITWSPSRVGAVLDDVKIKHTGARGVLVLPVRGNAEAVVSQDQKAIVLSRVEPTRVIGSDDVTREGGQGGMDTKHSKENKSESQPRSKALNVSSALDGLKITSFSAKRAIVNGPGGSRLIFNDEPVMLGGVMWQVAIQPNGIEFASGDDRVLLLFDRSLSFVNRVAGQSSASTSSSSAASNE